MSRTALQEEMRSVLETKKIVISAGSGGVGKTTVAAAMALQGAIMGKRVLVMTIDPAKRLANSLGLPELGNMESRVPAEKFARAGIDAPGSMSAMLLDTKRTFDDLVERFAPSAEVKKTIYANRFYKNLSTTMGGSNEFLAIEKLYDVFDKGAYDLIVLDTPPTKHAIDFLESPKRWADFLSRDVMKWFLKPYFSMTGGVMGSMVQQVFKMLEWATGIGFLKDVSEFFVSFEKIFEEMVGRMGKVEAILHRPETVFMLVTAPKELTLDESEFFYKKLAEMRVSFGGFIVNRVSPDYLGGLTAEGADFAAMETPDLARWLDAQLAEELRGRKVGAETRRELAENLAFTHALSEADRKSVAAFAARFPGDVPMHRVPRFDRDIYDFDGLLKIARALFGE